jgi:hypothetical protein
VRKTCRGGRGRQGWWLARECTGVAGDGSRMIVDAGEGDELDGRAGGHDMRAGRRHLPQQRKTKDNLEMFLARWARPTCTETTARRRARRRPAAETDNVIVRHQREKVRCHGKKVEKKECLTRNTPMVSDRVWAPKIREGEGRWWRCGGGAV